MSARVYIELVEGGFIVETYVGAMGTNKRVHLDADKAADDVRGRLLAHSGTQRRNYGESQ